MFQTLKHESTCKGKGVNMYFIHFLIHQKHVISKKYFLGRATFTPRPNQAFWMRPRIPTRLTPLENERLVDGGAMERWVWAEPLRHAF